MLPLPPAAPPTNHRRAPRNFNSPPASDPVSEQKRAVAAVDAMQKARPLRPPGVKR